LFYSLNKHIMQKQGETKWVHSFQEEDTDIVIQIYFAPAYHAFFLLLKFGESISNQLCVPVHFVPVWSPENANPWPTDCNALVSLLETMSEKYFQDQVKRPLLQVIQEHYNTQTCSKELQAYYSLECSAETTISKPVCSARIDWGDYSSDDEASN
jgi:hypothetical protein